MTHANIHKTLMVLTGNAWSLPLIRRAKELGLRVIVTDRSPTAPGLAIADVPLPLDTNDYHSILDAATKYRVDGVLTEQTDVGVLTAARVADQLGLPGIGPEKATAATNKFVMRECCRRAGIPIPRYELVRTIDQAVSAATSIGLPVVIKPIDGQSSRGVAKVWHAADIPYWFAWSKERSKSGDLLVEEMLEGQDTSVEGFIANGECHTLAICDKIKISPRLTVDLQLVYPARFTPTVVEELRTVNQAVVAAIGLTLGFTHAEYVVTPKGVRLLEIAARGCGAGVMTSLLPAMLECDLLGLRIRQALGEQVGAPRITSTRCGMLEFMLLPPGRLEIIEGLDKARLVPGILGINFTVTPGQIIRSAESGDGRPGYMHVVADTHEDLFRTSEQAKSLIKTSITTTPPPEAW
jgi:biotin carboxylase